MKLAELMYITGYGTQIRIGTETGNCWIVATSTREFCDSSLYHEFEKRTVIKLYLADEREEQNTCCALKPAICIIIDGYENGRI